MNNNLQEDLLDFLNSDCQKTPSDLKERVGMMILSELNPALKIIFFKLISIQVFVSSLTLIFCPQFDFTLLSRFDISQFFHISFGHYGCSLICGAIFLGSGSLFANIILRPVEIIKIKSSRPLYHLAISGIFVGIFSLLGSQIYLDLTLFWIFGSFVGSTISAILVDFAKALRRNVESAIELT